MLPARASRASTVDLPTGGTDVCEEVVLFLTEHGVAPVLSFLGLLTDARKSPAGCQRERAIDSATRDEMEMEVAGRCRRHGDKRKSRIVPSLKFFLAPSLSA